MEGIVHGAIGGASADQARGKLIHIGFAEQNRAGIEQFGDHWRCGIGAVGKSWTGGRGHEPGHVDVVFDSEWNAVEAASE